MKIRYLHLWDATPAEAGRLQKQLSSQVRLEPLARWPKLAAGLDCAFSPDKKYIAAAAVLLRLKNFEVIETASAVLPVQFPYIPGLLSFREAPVCIAAVEKLRRRPDVFLIDGQGLAHRRRLGLACHLGLFFDLPTIGCAKSRLIGQYENLPIQKGASAPLTDKGEIIGSVVRTRTDVKPLFISPGHRITFEQSVEVVLACCTRYRLPEPTRLAHQLVGRLKHQL